MSKHLKRFIFFDITIILLCGILAFFFFTASGKIGKGTSPQDNKTLGTPTPAQSFVKSNVWQIALSFNPQTQQITIASVSIKNGTANASPYHTSPYQLLVLDKNQHVLFQTDIQIAQQILYNIFFPSGTPPQSLPQSTNLDTLVTIPYFADAQTIQVTKNNQKILEFSPPKQLSFLPSFIQQSYAATCSLLHIVFVSDGYINMSSFHADVQKAEATFTSKQPFAANTSIFDFKTVDNPISNPLGCKQNNNLQVFCLYSNASLSKISNVVFSNYPQLPQDTTYTKIVVLVNGAPQPVGGGGLILGVASAIGGQFGVFQNQMFFESTATMEVLGHDVGQLYDRYLYPPVPGSASDFGNTIPAPFISNCTTNPQGESLWKSAGASQAYKGCTSQYLYAPAPLDCGAQGSHSTIMSAAGCAGLQFDGVEQYYLKTKILPNYCAPTPTPTPTFTPTPTKSGPTQSLPNTSTTTGALPTTANNSPSTLQTFDCQPDPSCNSNKKTLQLCPLKCTPK